MYTLASIMTLLQIVPMKIENVTWRPGCNVYSEGAESDTEA